jgi:hypothetical protein
MNQPDIDDLLKARDAAKETYLRLESLVTQMNVAPVEDKYQKAVDRRRAQRFAKAKLKTA